MDTWEFISKNEKANVKDLALQAKKYPQVDMPFAIDQIAGLQTARLKLPSYAAISGLHYPHHLSMEQCSSESTAAYKAQLVESHSSPSERNSFADLTAGFGVDFSFIAQLFKQAAYVERQAYLCELAQHNFPLLGLSQVSIHNIDGLQYLEQMQTVDWLFLDPARRDKNGGKVVSISDCEPDVAELEDTLLQKAHNVLIKLSPMLDISLAIHTLKHVREVHVVATNNECKELLFWLSRATTPTNEILIRSYNQQKEEQLFSFTLAEEEQACASYTSTIGKYLYEPNAALIKSGGFKSICTQLGLQKLHPNSHLYTSDNLQDKFPGRVFQVERVCGFSKKELKELQQLKQANLTTRNFPQSVQELRKRLKLSDGGTHYLFATTLQNGDKVLIDCLKSFIS